ncbi:MAG: FAD-dependent oxidoreductase [Anaerolineales bacterium]|nr:FAD-dependent oxidoreductase [Anaerolineales bacterium]
MTRYLLIGTGVAAISALEAIRSVDERGEVSVVSDDPHGYYSRPGLAYYLTGELEESLLFPYQKADFSRLNARFYRARVSHIFPSEQEIELEGGARLPYDKLLIATGAQALPLKVPGADLAGVHKLDNLADARALLAHARRGRPALVTGGGITALELAEGLASRGMKVHYVFRSERYWPAVLDETESRIIESLLRREGMTLSPQTEVTEILGRNGKVTGARLSNGKIIPADLIAYAIGIAPRIGLAREAGIACERGILVNERMETSLPGIYAAGDAAQVYDPAAGKHVLDSLWTPAREQGRAAGRNMAGQPTAYCKSIPFNVTRLAGLTVTIIGAVAVPSPLTPLPQGEGKPPSPLPPLPQGERNAPSPLSHLPQGEGNTPSHLLPSPTGRGAGGEGRGEGDLLAIARGDSETWRELPHAIIAQSGFEVNRLRLMVGKTHLLGAIVMGDQKLSAPLQKLIREKVEITPIRAQLLAPDAPIADILAGFVRRGNGKQGN